MIAYDLLKYQDFESFKEHSNPAVMTAGFKGYDKSKEWLGRYRRALT